MHLPISRRPARQERRGRAPLQLRRPDTAFTEALCGANLVGEVSGPSSIIAVLYLVQHADDALHRGLVARAGERVEPAEIVE